MRIDGIRGLAAVALSLAACGTTPLTAIDESKSGGPRAGPKPTRELHDAIAAKDRERFAGHIEGYPLANYGAVEVGEHLFYRLFPDKPEKLVEVALFTMVWKKEGDAWKLARVLSFDHRLTQAGRE